MRDFIDFTCHHQVLAFLPSIAYVTLGVYTTKTIKEKEEPLRGNNYLFYSLV